MKSRNDARKTFISYCSPYKCEAIFHSKVFLKTQTVPIWICLKFHWAREIISYLKLFQAFINFNHFTILFKNSFISGSFDSCTWIPAELITQWIFIRLLCNWETSAVAFITEYLISFLIRLMNYFHGAHDINAWIKSAFI